MGIDLPAFEFLLRANQQTGDFGRTLTLGRQRMLITDATRPRFTEVLSRYRPDIRIEDVERHTHVDALIECLGGEPHFMDNSAYEGAQVIQDLNEPLPAELEKSYDTVIDIGTLEHVFNIGMGLLSVAKIPKPGGQFLSLQVANHHLGHGFWQFGPEAYFRTFCQENGYEPLLCELFYRGAFHEVRDPEVAGRRLPIQTPGYTYIVFAAKRVAARPIFADGWPVQADYMAAWKIFLSRRAMAEGDAGGAERILREAIAAHPRNPLYLAELSRVVRADPGRLAEADELTAKAVAMVDDNPVITTERGAVVALLERASSPAAPAETEAAQASPPPPAPAVAPPLTDPVAAPVTASQPTAVELAATIDIGSVTVAFDDPRVPEATRVALIKGRYEFKERELSRRLVAPGDRVIELGTGMGVVSLTIARLIGGEAVLSFEANPAIIELAEENAERNGLDVQFRNAVASPRAITEPGATIEFFPMKSFEASSTRRVSPGQRPVAVPTTILEDEIATHRANVLVMDIEGFERDIVLHADLSGLERVVLETHPKVLGVEGVLELAARFEEAGLHLRRELIFGDVMAFDRMAEPGIGVLEVVRDALELEAAWRAGDMGRCHELITTLLPALDENAYFQHIRSRVQRQRGEDGLPAAERSAQLGSGDHGLFADLVGLYLGANRVDDARRALEIHREMFPGSPDLDRLSAAVEQSSARLQSPADRRFDAAND